MKPLRLIVIMTFLFFLTIIFPSYVKAECDDTVTACFAQELDDLLNVEVINNQQNKQNIKVSIEGARITNSTLCVAIDSTGNGNVNPAVYPKSIILDANGSGSIDFQDIPNNTQNGQHSLSIYGGNVRALSSNMNVFQPCGSTTFAASGPTSTPTPTSAIPNCRRLGDSCIVEPDVNNELLLTPLCNPVTEVCDYTTQTVVQRVFSQSTDDISKAIEQATGECGRNGLQCCLPNLIRPPNISHGWFSEIVDAMRGFLETFMNFDSMTKEVESEINSAVGGKICKEVGTVPELTYNDDKTEIVENF